MFKRNRDIERRGRLLKDGRRGKSGPVIHWLERDQRVKDNWALLYARQEALVYDRPLHAVFCFDRGTPGSGLRANRFQLAGLDELQQALARLGIGCSILVGEPRETLPRFVHRHDACLLTTDFNPLRYKRQQLDGVCGEVDTPVAEIDAHNIIPAWQTSEKQEYAAYTIRPKIRRLLDEYLTEFPVMTALPKRADIAADPVDVGALCARVGDTSAAAVDWLESGEEAAARAMERALGERLPHYDARRNDPCRKGQSDLSPYLHFGHLAAQRLAAAVVADTRLMERDREAFLEELIVRRELADNFCFYQPDYDRFAGFPEWGRNTLHEHRPDRRPYRYSLAELEHAETHEPLWNACQHDLGRRGKLHGYLRMYWAKKILEWTAEPEEALEYAIILNDRYSLDGCDPNGYAGIAWSIGGVHDRAWPERPIFGKIRYMNERGCRRKFRVDEYILSVSQSGTQPESRRNG